MEGGHNAPGPDLRPPTNSSIPTGSPSTPVLVSPACDTISISYDITTAVICGICFVVGIVYCFFGYRLFKVSMFSTGFLFGSLVTFLICQEEKILPWEGKVGVAVAAGVLCGLITMLVQYVGVFMTGFHLGLLLGIASLTVLEVFYHPTTKWLCVGVLFGGGLLFALFALRFQKGLTILSTCVVGGAMITCALDYFVEMLNMGYYVWDRVLAEVSPPVCWFSWILLGLWPAIILVGLLAQWKITAKGQTLHKQGRGQKRFEVKPSTSAAAGTGSPEAPTAVENDMPAATQAFIPAASAPSSSKRQKLDLAKARKKGGGSGGGGGGSGGGGTNPDGFLTLSSRYRHLYRVRRFNGDVIAQTPKLQNVVVG